MSNNPTSKVQRLRHDRDQWFDSDRQWAQDKSLSYKARGIMAYVMSQADDWTIWKSDLVNKSAEDGQYAVQTAIQELIDGGYAQYIRLRDPETKQFRGKRLVMREATDLEWPETLKIQGSGNPNVGKPEDRETGVYRSKQRAETNNGQKRDNDNSSNARARISDCKVDSVDAITEAAFGQPLMSSLKKEAIEARCREYGQDGWDALRAVCAVVSEKGWNATGPLIHKKLEAQLELIDEADEPDDDFDAKAQRIFEAAGRGAGLNQ